MPRHLQLTTMPGQILASPVRELLAVAQVEPLDVVAVLRERRQRRVTHRLAGNHDQDNKIDQFDNPQKTSKFDMST